MGVFDRILFTCPGCGKTIEEQSKAGKCVMASHNSSEVPMNIASDIEGSDIRCDYCDGYFTIVRLPPKAQTIPMGLVLYQD